MFVRALDGNSSPSDCSQFNECYNNQVQEKLTCPDDRPYFDAQNQECVQNRDVCFKCPHNEYELFAVPHVPKQFILCFKRKPVVSSCNTGLVFDGRPGVHQCNNEWGAEDQSDLENTQCPSISNEPVYMTIQDTSM